MSFEDTFRQQLHGHGDAVALPSREPNRATRRARQRRRNRRMAAAGALVAVAAAGITIPLAGGGDGTEPVSVASPGLAGLTATGPLNLDWQVTDGGLYAPRVAFQDGAGTVYALSTGPGARAGEEGEDVVGALYRLTDAGTWEPVVLDGDRPPAADVSGGDDGVLYAVSTAPGATGVEARLSTSGDGGETWATEPFAVPGPPSDAIDWLATTSVQVESLGTTTLAVVSTTHRPDYVALFPEMGDDLTLSTEVRDDGVALVRPGGGEEPGGDASAPPAAAGVPASARDEAVQDEAASGAEQSAGEAEDAIAGAGGEGGGGDVSQAEAQDQAAADAERAAREAEQAIAGHGGEGSGADGDAQDEAAADAEEAAGEAEDAIAGHGGEGSDAGDPGDAGAGRSGEHEVPAQSEVVRTVTWAEMGVEGPEAFDTHHQVVRNQGDGWAPVEGGDVLGNQHHLDLDVAGGRFVITSSEHLDQGVNGADGDVGLRAHTSTDGTEWSPVNSPNGGWVVPAGQVLVEMPDTGTTLQVSADHGATWNPVDLAEVAGIEPDAYIGRVDGGPLGLALAVAPADGGVDRLVTTGDLVEWSTTPLADIVGEPYADGVVTPIVGNDRIVVTATAPGDGEGANPPPPSVTAVGTPTR